MPAPKFLRLIGGVITEVWSIATSAGAADADKIPATDAAGRLDATFMPGGPPVATSAGAGSAGILPKLDAGGRLDLTMMPVGVFPDTQSIVASEALSGGNLVNVWNDAGTLKVRKADATTAGKEANGFVLAAAASGAAAQVYFDGVISGLAGLTLGAPLFLATTAGNATDAAPAGAGNVVQAVGKALSASTMTFDPGSPVTLA